jgi:hypothetical protein
MSHTCEAIRERGSTSPWRHQQFQQAELLGRQVHALAVARDPAAQQIQLQIGDAQQGAFVAGRGAG